MQNEQWLHEQLTKMPVGSKFDEQVIALTAKYQPETPAPAGTPLIGLDIDGTLTFSMRKLHLDRKGFKAPLSVTEVVMGKPAGYMTDLARRMFDILTTNAWVVPVTSRGIEHFKPINLFDENTPYAVLNTGGRILVRGHEDTLWSNYIDTMLSHEIAPSSAVQAIFQRFSDAPWFHEMSHYWPDFVQIKLDHYTDVPFPTVQEIRAGVEGLGWQMSKQGRYMFAIPNFLSKGEGFEEIIARTDPTYTITAGDSTFDIPLLEAGDYAFRPNHGELSTHDYRAPNLQVTDNVGVLAGEEILARALAIVASGQS